MLLVLAAVSSSYGQAFQNLDFESTTVTDLPPKQFEFVSVEVGLPGWSVYIGTDLQTQITHNSIPLLGYNVSIWGPAYPLSMQPLEGSYSVMLFTGGLNTNGQSASIAQTGAIPASANSLRFVAQLSNTNAFSVSVAGQSLPVIPLGSGAFGCDVSAFAGSTDEVRFTAGVLPFGSMNVLDAITFSPDAIPEPSAFLLTGAGVAMLWAFHRRKRTS